MIDLEYSVGNEYSPTDPFGRIVLKLAGGQVTLDHYFRAGNGKWEARVEEDVLEALASALERARFPEFPGNQGLPPDSAVASLTVSGRVSGTVSVSRHGAALLPGYQEAFELLDAIAMQASEGRYKGGKPLPRVLVRGVKRVA